MNRRFSAGQSVEDYCRACKTDRMHTVIVVDGEGRPLRVSCGFCDSEHNYRGGPRIGFEPGAPAAPPAHRRQAGQPFRAAGPTQRDPVAQPFRAAGGAPGDQGAQPFRAAVAAREPFPIVSERERTAPAMSEQDGADLEMLLRRIIREETGITPVAPAEKWRGGHLVLRPGNPELQERSWPIETFFHKVVMLRNRLRTLEQQINAADLPDEVKVKVQSYISGCYGSLTSFNVLFADEGDQFKGAGE